MTVTLNRLLVLVAVICFAVAWMLTTHTLFDHGNPSAWGYIGLAFFAGSFLP